MTVHVVFKCGGCFVEAEGTTYLRREFRTVEDVTPEGWVAFDPYTHCCYCPECWASVIADDDCPKTVPEAAEEKGAE